MPTDITTLNSWAELKTFLVSEDEWLKQFAISFHEQLREPATTDGYRFDPLQLDVHLRQLVQQAVKLRAIQKEAFDLEIQGVRSAADYRLFQHDSELQEEMDHLRLGLIELSRREEHFSAAASAHDGTNDGHALHMKALEGAASDALKNAKEIDALTNTRHQLRRAYERLFHERHRTPRNAENFAERHARVVRLARPIYHECLARIEAVRLGASVAMGVTLPTLDSGTDVVDIVEWAQHANRRLEMAREHEIEASVLIPLTQPWKHGGTPLISPPDFASAVTHPGEIKQLSFDFSGVLEDISRARLVAVGVALDGDWQFFENKLDKLAYVRARVEVDLPDQDERLGEYAQRKSFLLGDVSMYGRTLPISPERHSAITNASMSGVWQLRIHNRVVFNKDYNVELDTRPEFLKDVKIFIRYRLREGGGV